MRISSSALMENRLTPEALFEHLQAVQKTQSKAVLDVYNLADKKDRLLEQHELRFPFDEILLFEDADADGNDPSEESLEVDMCIPQGLCHT